MRIPTRGRRSQLVLLALAAGAAAPALTAQVSAFDWTLAGHPSGSGSVSGESLHVVGPDGGFCLPHTTQMETTLPADGTLHVDVAFLNLDSWVGQGHAIFDSPALLLDGQLVQPPAAGCCPDGWPSGSYHFDVGVEFGQVLGLGVWAADCIEGPGVADFTNLVFVPASQTVFPVALDLRERFEFIGETGPPPAYPGSQLGADAAGAGDIDGDGRGDLVALAPGGSTPSLVVRSGRDGSVLLSVAGDFADASVVAGAGLFDGDAVPDLIIGMPGATVSGKTNAGRCEVRSGADGALLLALEGQATGARLGIAVSAAGDVDGDGRGDVLVAQLPQFVKKGMVRVLGGPDGHLIASYVGASQQNGFGSSVAGGDDADADGVPDVVIGEPGASAASVGTVHVFSSATQQPLFTRTGSGGFGSDVAWAGDVDGDGHDDLLVASPYASPTAEKQGSVLLCSGASGATLLVVDGPGANALFGRSLAGGADLDGDGRLDFAVLANGAGGPEVRVHDALDGVLRAVLSAPSGTPAGRGLDVLPDVDGDGLADLVCSSPATGSVVAYQAPGTVILFHQLDRGPPPAIAVTGEPLAGMPLSIAIAGLLPGAPLVLVLGASELAESFKGGVLVPTPHALLPFVADGAGAVSLGATWPAGLPQWSRLWVQAWAPDSDAYQGWICTDAIALTQVGP